MSQCIDCINSPECLKTQSNSFAAFCIEQDMCSFKQDENRPKYSLEVAKQLIFDCAMELYYEHEGLTREEVADKLVEIVSEIGKM